MIHLDCSPRWLLVVVVGLGGLAARGFPNALAADNTRPSDTRDAGSQPPAPTPDGARNSPRVDDGPGVRGGSTSVSSSLNVNRWAIVVGISKYQHKEWNLKYADRDASQLHALLRSPAGGGFEEDHIVFLTDEQATTRNITRALRGFLKKPARDDVVLLYFACHGTPDPDRPGVLYLLTHDTDPDDIAGTALPMREIQDSMRDYLAAERTVILADTCHSAAIGGSGRRNVGVANAAAVNNYLEQVSRSRVGTALLTSAEANEVSAEDKRWGGGHGVFTHFLLEGMRGNADNQVVDGVVTTGELFEYVRSQVIAATNSNQHPAIGTAAYDRLFPMAITGGASARRHYDLGRRLDELGWVLREKRLFRSAAQHLGEAQRLFGAGGATRQQAEASRLRGQALIAAGDHRGAVAPLQRAIALDREGTPPETDFLLGVALASRGLWDEAREPLKSFLASAASDARAPVAQQLLDEAGPPGTSYAMLIGINSYKSQRNIDLRGPRNDVAMIREALVDRCGFSLPNVTTILDGEATRDKILLKLDSYRRTLRRRDTLWIFYFGHHVNNSNEYYLFVNDSDLNDMAATSIGGTMLSDLLGGIPASTTLFLDTGGPDRGTSFFGRMSRGTRFNVLLGASPGQLGHESVVPGDRAEVHGVFSHALAAELRRLRPSTTYIELSRRLEARMENESKAYWFGVSQDPLFLGDPLQHVLGPWSILADFDFGLMDGYSSFTSQGLETLAGAVSFPAAIENPEALLQLGRVMLDRGANHAAAGVLGRAASSLRETRPEALLYLAVAHLRTGHATGARGAIADFARRSRPTPPKASIEETLAMIAQSGRGRKRALLVGINEYKSSDVDRLKGAVNDVQAWKSELIRILGFRDSEIVVLLDRDATRKAILEQFQELVQETAGQPALFFFAGNGSLTREETPTLVPVDGRESDVYDIEVADLKRMTADKPANLLTIFDVGWLQGNHPDDRYVVPDKRERPRPRDLGIPRPRLDPEAFMTVGRHTLYTTGLVTDRSTRAQGPLSMEAELPPLVGEEGRVVHGRLTQALLRSLDGVDPGTLSVGAWVERALAQPETSPLLLKSDRPEDVIFSDYQAIARIEARLRRISLAPAREAIVLLRLLLEQRPDIVVDASIDLGIACAAAEQYPESIAAFEAAIEHGRSRADPALGEAHYHLGRVLFEANTDLARSVSEFRQSVELRPEDARGRYELSQAIRRLVQQDLLAEVESNLRLYREAGDPLGREEEVRAFLRSRERPSPLGEQAGGRVR